MKKLSYFLNVLGFFQIVLALILLVAMIWLCELWLLQLFISNILLFFLVLFVWIVLCRDSNKKEAEK